MTAVHRMEAGYRADTSGSTGHPQGRRTLATPVSVSASRGSGASVVLHRVLEQELHISRMWGTGELITTIRAMRRMKMATSATAASGLEPPFRRALGDTSHRQPCILQATEATLGKARGRHLVSSAGSAAGVADKVGLCRPRSMPTLTLSRREKNRRKAPLKLKARWMRCRGAFKIHPYLKVSRPCRALVMGSLGRQAGLGRLACLSDETAAATC